jgi:hypothetical protein
MSLSRNVTTSTGAELSLIAVGLLGGAISEPVCPAVGQCTGGADTPSVFSAAILSAYSFVAASPLRLSGGIGYLRSTGGYGFDHDAAAAAVIGIELVPRSTRSWLPTIGVRVAQLARPAGGARQLILPGVGLVF